VANLLTLLSVDFRHSPALAPLEQSTNLTAAAIPLQARRFCTQGLDAAELRNLTATRAALLSPVFQESGSLPSLAQAAAPQRRLLSLTLVRARLAAAPALRWERVHSACGRGLTDSMRLGGGPSVNVADDSKGASLATRLHHQHNAKRCP